MIDMMNWVSPMPFIIRPMDEIGSNRMRARMITLRLGTLPSHPKPNGEWSQTVYEDAMFNPIFKNTALDHLRRGVYELWNNSRRIRGYSPDGNIPIPDDVEGLTTITYRTDGGRRG